MARHSAQDAPQAPKSTSVVGSIGPNVDISETPSWDAPSKCLFIEDAKGRLHGRIEWLSEEVDENFLRELANLSAVAMRSAMTHFPSAAS